MRLAIVLVYVFLLSTTCAVAQNPKRVAFVVGNENYRPLTALNNPVRDARAISDLLSKNGYAVRVHTNLDHAAFERAIDEFVALSQGAEEAVVFYSGHGMGVERGGQFINALAPVDASIDCRTRRAERVIAMEEILSRLAHIPNKLAMFDACRSEPCPEAGVRGSGFGALRFATDQTTPSGAATRSPTASPSRGFIPVGPTVNSSLLVAFATDLGAVALDGAPGGNSPFAEALIEQLSKNPKVPYREVLDATATRVVALTANIQNPWVVTKGGEPLICLAGIGCEGRGRLRTDKALSDAMGAAFDAQRLRNSLQLHQALETSLNAIETLRQAQIEIPEPLRREFHELLILTPKRRLVVPADIRRSGIKMSDAIGRFRVSENGRTGAIHDEGSRIVFVDFEQSKPLHNNSSDVWDGSGPTISPDGSLALVCSSSTGNRTRCKILALESGRIVKIFDLPPTFWQHGYPQFAPDNRYVALPYRDNVRGSTSLKIHLEPILSADRPSTISLPVGEDKPARHYFDGHGFLIQISLDSKVMGVLGPSRFHLFTETANGWTGLSLDGIYDQVGRPEGHNHHPSFGVDFLSRRFAFATPSIPVVLIDYEIAGDRLVLKERQHYKECRGCSVLGFANGGRQIALAGLGTDGYVGAYSLPANLERGRVEKIFMVQQSGRTGFATKNGTRVFHNQVDGKFLQFLDFGHHPIRRSYVFAGSSDQIFVKDSGKPGIVLIDDSTNYRRIEFDIRKGNVISERRASSADISSDPPTKRGGSVLFDDRYQNDKVVALTLPALSGPARIGFYLPGMSLPVNFRHVVDGERTLVLSNDWNGRIDVFTLPLTIEDQIAAAHEILGK